MQPVDPYLPDPADYNVDPYQRQTYKGQPLLESLGGLESLQLPQAHGIGEGLLYGLLGGVGASGTRALERRAQFERDQTRRQAETDQERISASRDYRRDRGQALRAKEGDRLSSTRDQAKYERDNPQVTPEMIAANPALARIPPGTRVPASVAYAAPPDRSALDETIRHNKAMEGIDRTKANKEAKAPKPSTGEQKQALAFYNRGKEALGILDQSDNNGHTLEDRIASVNPALAAYGQRTINALKGSDRQKYEQAQRAFTQAKLRKESGAAISTSEYQSDAQTYFAQPGDTPDVVANKKAAREGVLAGLKFQAGPAYSEFYGDPGNAAASTAAPASPLSVPKKGGWFDSNKPGGR